MNDYRSPHAGRLTTDRVRDWKMLDVVHRAQALGFDGDDFDGARDYLDAISRPSSDDDGRGDDAPAAPATLLLTTTAHPTLYQHPGPDGEPTHPALGRLIQPRHTSSIEQTADAGIPWAADNDCFQGLDEAAYRRMLDRITGLPGCKFVTVPDVVGDAAATAEQFDVWAPVLEELDLPLGYVAQDGIDLDAVPWDRIAALFIGGTDDFKLGPAGAAAARRAKSEGKWVHWGRVNSRKRFDLIRATGTADSFDGSKWSRFRKTYLDQGLEWCLERDVERMALELAARAPWTREQAPVDRVRMPVPAGERPTVGTVELADGRRVDWIVGDPLVTADRLNRRGC